MRRYLGLFAGMLALGLIGMAVARQARLSPQREDPPAERPIVTIALVVTADHHITPSLTSVPKDHLVRLSVTNRDRRPVTLTLVGYQDRLNISDVPPDSVWRGEFLADRPGDEFAWMLEGAPVGRLQVSGSHLEEGHR
jgi:hypothetical protein